jgi:SAM-dependent methyltransferase
MSSSVALVGFILVLVAFAAGVGAGYRLRRRRAQRPEKRSAQPAYSLEQDARVTPILGSEGFDLSRRLEAAKRIDPDQFFEAIDAIIRRTPYEENRIYGLYHRPRFFELFNLAAELTATVENPRVLEFGVSEQTLLYRTFLPGVRLHLADCKILELDRMFTGEWCIDQSYYETYYKLDLTDRASREAALIPHGSFDLVVFTEVLEHLIANPVEIIEWLLWLVKPDGHLLLTTPNMFRKANMPAYLNYDNPLAAFPKEEDRATFGAHLREYSHIELLRFVQAAGGRTRALIFSSCWDGDATLMSVERQNLVLVVGPNG